jgi:hypothetical protein
VPAAATVAVLDPPDEADEPRKRWIEDPHLDMLTPGQRYTAVIAVAFVAALMTLGARGSGPEPFVLDRPAPAAVAAPASTTTSSPPKAATTTTTLPPVVDPMTVPAGLPADSALPPETTTTTEATVTTAPPPATTTTTAPPTTTTTLLPIPPLG